MTGLTTWRASAAVRLVTGVLIALYSITFEPPAGISEPAIVLPLALIGAAALVAASVAEWALGRRGWLIGIMFTVDVLTPVGFVWLYIFDPSPSVFVLGFVGAAQGALSLGMRGGVFAGAVISVGYVASEVFAEPLSGTAANPVLVGMRVVALLFVGILVGRAAQAMLETERRRVAAERELALSEDSLRAIFEAAPVALIQMDHGGIVEAWSPQAERTFGWTAQEAMGRFLPFVSEEKSEESAALRGRVFAGELQAEADVIRHRRDGSPVDIDLVLAPIRDEHGDVAKIIGAYSDITERKRAERELRWLNRAMRAITLANQVLVRATDESELLGTVCEILVREAGYSLVWVGYAEDDEARSVRPVARAGRDEGYVDLAKITWADTERGRGPVGKAIRTGRPTVAADLATDPAFQLWRDRALARGFASSAAIPLRDGTRTFGTLNLYSPRVGAFDTAELGLLMELADDLAFGVIAIRTREERARAVSELQVADEHRRMLLSRLVDAEEQERARIAADIHDDTLQVMSAASMHLGVVKERLEDRDEVQQLDELDQTVRSAISRLRNLIFELRPLALDHDGPGAAIEAHMDRLFLDGGTRWRLDDRLVEQPGPQTRVTLYRVAHEALANVRAHADAGTVEVTLEAQEGGYLTRIRDDGAGFDPALAEVPRAGHLGLPEIRERLEQAGGWLSIDSAPGAGTTIEFWLPGGA